MPVLNLVSAIPQVKAGKMRDVKDALSKLDAAPLIGDTPEGLRKFVDSGICKYAEIIRNAGIKLER